MLEELVEAEEAGDATTIAELTASVETITTEVAAIQSELDWLEAEMERIGEQKYNVIQYVEMLQRLIDRLLHDCS